MNPRRRNLLVAGMVGGAALAAGVLVALRGAGGVDAKADALSNARFMDLQGKSRALSEWRGKVVVANFWATWCAPCLEEIPLLMATRKIEVSKGVEVVGIAIDQAAKVEAFAAKLQIDYPVLVAEADALNLVRKLGNQSGGLPFTVFVDRTGRPVKTKIGVLRKPELTAILAAIAGSSG
jgi:thiol-disulfide isomerase/thioredoxin